MLAKAKYIYVTYFGTLMLPTGSDFSANDRDGDVGKDRIGGQAGNGFTGRKCQNR
jgi:hypothetical protein